MTDQKSFETWAIVEVMGHRQFAGFVSEQAIGGTSFVRVDVPEVFAERQDGTRSGLSKHVGLDIEAIDDELVLGFCETCGKPLFDHNEFFVDVDGVCWCVRHDNVLED